MITDLLNYAESFIARHEDQKTVEQVFAEFHRVREEHQDFERYLEKNNIEFRMPKKSEAILERRKLFINWYIQKYQKDRHMKVLVEELTTLVFASETTIYSVIYEY